MSSPAVRAFVALEIPDGMRGRIAALMDSLRPTLPGLRWLQPSTIHLTLRFLGDVTPAQIETLQPRLAAAAITAPAGDVSVAELGMFPARGAPRILWLGCPLPDTLVALQRACEAAALACGLPPEDKPFRSHVTLGRWRERMRRPVLPPVDLGVTRLCSLVLYESRLDTRGAVHTPLATFPLSD